MIKTFAVLFFGSLMITALGVVWFTKHSNADSKWRFYRQVVDEKGQPVANLNIIVTSWKSTKELRVKLLGPISFTNEIRTDANGSFELAATGSIISFRIEKAGYVPQEFSFSDTIFPPGNIQPKQKITLRPNIQLSRPDVFDAKGERELLLKFTKENSRITFDFDDTQSVNQSRETLSAIYTNGSIKLVAGRGVLFKPVEWPQGITVDSWKANHRTADLEGAVSEWTTPTGVPNQIAGALFIRTPSFFCRAFLITVWTNQYRLVFDLSDDKFFGD